MVISYITTNARLCAQVNLELTGLAGNARDNLPSLGIGFILQHLHVKIDVVGLLLRILIARKFLFLL